MSHKWIQEKKLAAETWISADAPEPLRHILVGGAGSGKTTTLLVIEALLDFFLGPASMRKSAPTNTAARLLGGDTVHALFKLPRGTLLSKRGTLSKAALKKMKKNGAPPPHAPSTRYLSCHRKHCIRSTSEADRSPTRRGQSWGACR